MNPDSIVENTNSPEELKEGDIVLAIEKAGFFNPVSSEVRRSANHALIGLVAQIHFQDGSVRLETPIPSAVFPHRIDVGRSNGYISKDLLVPIRREAKHKPLSTTAERGIPVWIMIAENTYAPAEFFRHDKDAGYSTLIVRSYQGDEALVRADPRYVYQADR